MNHLRAMNHATARVAEKFRHSRIVAFSTGNIYPMTPITSGGLWKITLRCQPVSTRSHALAGKMFQYGLAIQYSGFAVSPQLRHDVPTAVSGIAQSVKTATLLIYDGQCKCDLAG